jgi:SAM-dependent methyltransferase
MCERLFSIKSISPSIQIEMKALNLGCGSRFHPEFVNIDAVSSSPHVLAYDLQKGIPFPDATFDVVYQSHLLEHFKKENALDFLKECYRVLKLSGVIRVAVPDLEQIVRAYLDELEKALQRAGESERNYDWMVLELYDQAVRGRPGGAMLEYLKQDSIPNEAFVCQRIGVEARRIIDALKKEASTSNSHHERPRNYVARLRSIPRFFRARLLKMILSDEDYRALEIGRFRSEGEIHQWMYDRYSLGRILKRAGFQDPKAVRADESRIPGWTAYHLDTEPDGTVCKPDSLFMEAVKL